MKRMILTRTQGGDEHPNASSMPSASQVGDSTVQGETETGDSDDEENVEIEFERDDGEGEIGESVKVVTLPTLTETSTPPEPTTNSWSERRKTWFMIIPKSLPQPVLKSKYAYNSEATGRILRWFFDTQTRFFAIKRDDGVQYLKPSLKYFNTLPDCEIRFLAQRTLINTSNEGIANNEPQRDEHIQDANVDDHVIPPSPRDGQVEDASDSESTESDDNNPDAERVGISVDKHTQPVSIPSRRLKMVARRNVKKTTGPPLESSSRSKRKELDVDYNPSEDLDQDKSKAKKSKASRPKFVTPPVTAEVTPETQRLLDALLSTPLVVTISSSPSVQIPVTTSSPTASIVPPSSSSVPPHNTRRSTHTWYLQSWILKQGLLV
ncbi:hypothetical protein L1987_06893 [Smallanthus sonchifolius]|uniref:Uncharacterized protein n=1 Tax=Smallanthus sonchifolius TaxID=185202 RepID=A0ACB9JZN3_9ASTR|nr:hypothetical protein L1987_06893 [Smallanthus sonchifolius]